MKSHALIHGSIVFSTLTGVLVFAAATRADETTRVTFDIPEKIECRDATPEKYAAAHPSSKVIEAKFRISAKFIEGDESSIIDFNYMLSSPEMRLDIVDFLPNTTLESTYADDRIEVADFNETKESNSQSALVGYSVFSLNALRNQSSKRQEQNLYQKVAPKSLVLASGTSNRGHGVFYKLRPSKGATLEGAKDFTFLAVVPKDWRGDWCTFLCLGRYNKKQFVTSTVALAGVESNYVGMYLVGDREANDLSTKLCQLQQANNAALTQQYAKEAAKAAEAMHVTAPNALAQVDDFLQQFVCGKVDDKADRQLQATRREVLEVGQKLATLAGKTSSTTASER